MFFFEFAGKPGRVLKGGKPKFHRVKPIVRTHCAQLGPFDVDLQYTLRMISFHVDKCMM